MLYYSHVNEGSDPERKLLNRGNYDLIACVAGSGERLIALLDHCKAKVVHAIDINPEALFLTELKVKSLMHLKVPDYLSFTGVLNDIKTNERIAQYRKVAPLLSPEARTYWDAQTSLLAAGISSAGQFEKFLARSRPFVNRLLGSAARRSFLFERGGRCTHATLVRWNVVRSLFRYRTTFKLFGNTDEAFVAPDANVRKISSALNDQFESGTAYRSFVSHLIFNGHLGDMPESNRPVSLQVPFLRKVQERLLSRELVLHYHSNDFFTACQDLSLFERRNVFFSVSDILSYCGFDYIIKLMDRVFYNPSSAHAIVIRSFLRNELESDKIAFLSSHPDVRYSDLSEEDVSGMYHVAGFENKTKSWN